MSDPKDLKNFDIRNHRLPGKEQLRPKRKIIKGKFLRGPIPWSWLSRAAPLKGKALAVGVCIWHLHGLKNQQQIALSGKLVRGIGVSRSSLYRGLEALEKAGLISVERHPGRNPIVTLKE
jgi:DNA-binding MarR family transcriptional regulator